MMKQAKRDWCYWSNYEVLNIVESLYSGGAEMDVENVDEYIKRAEPLVGPKNGQIRKIELVAT